MVRLPGIAPGHAPWRDAILLLNHSREIKRAGSVRTLPARAISTKNKHLLATHPVPTRGFTAVVSVFGGTPSNKPFRCKLFVRVVRLVRACAPIGCVRAHRAGGRFDPARLRFELALSDIIEMSRLSCSQSSCLSVQPVARIPGNKKPCVHFGRQGEETLFRFVTRLPKVHPV